MPWKEAAACFIFKGRPREGVHGIHWDHLQLCASTGNLKGSSHQYSEEGRQKSLQIKGCQGKGTDFLITSVLWDCWSFPEKEMKELCSCVGQSRKPWGLIASSEFFLLPVFYIPHRNGSLG